jgi:mannose-1-phosphate guanylyltransferase
MSPSRAMVLAAGLGLRMRPLTTLLPKPALAVLNRPLIAHALDHLASHGVTMVVVNSHLMPETLEQTVLRWAPKGLEVKFSRERTILGTAGGLKKAARHFAKETFYLVNSDSLTDADLTAAAAAHAASGRLATLVVRRHDAASGYRPVLVAREPSAPAVQPGSGEGRSAVARVQGIAGRTWWQGSPGGDASEPRTFTGIHVLEPEVLDAIRPSVASDINADVYPRLLDENPDAVGAWLHEGWWFEAGDPSRYLELNLELLSRSRRDAVVGPGFFIDEEARVERAVIGSRSRLERGTTVQDCVLWDDVVVPEGIALQGCIVTDGIRIPGSMSDVIVMKDEEGEIQATPLKPARRVVPEGER